MSEIRANSITDAAGTGAPSLPNGVSVADGSAAAPSITNIGDTNTGVFFPAADTIAFAEGGAEVARFDSSGNLGIGTSSVTAGAKVDIRGPLLVKETGGGDIFLRSSVDGSNTPAIQVSTSSPLAFYTSNTERARITSGGDFQFNSGYGSVSTAYGCRAWVNFNGTGTVAIRASGNVSSITDNGVGDYTINFANAMPDANYAYSHSYSSEVNVQHTIGFFEVMTAGSLRVRHYSAANSANSADKAFVAISVFR